MKILHTSFSWLAQTKNWLYTQCKHLPPGFEQHILCQRVQNLDQFPMPIIHCFENEQEIPLWIKIGQNMWRQLWSVLGVRKNIPYMIGKAVCIHPDIVHSHFGSQGWADMPLVHKCGARHVVTYYGFDVSKLPEKKKWRKRYIRLFESADQFLCEGPHMARSLNALGCPARKITVQHLGIELDKYPYQPRFWSSGQPLRVLLAGTFSEKKGLPYAVESLGRLSQNYDMHVTIIGDAAPKSKQQAQEKQNIIDAINRYNMTDNVTLMGYQPHSRLLQEAYKHHLFVSPSVTAASGDTEGGAPVTIIEMAATGMPVISTTHCDIPAVLNYGQEGWLADERDVDGLVRIIETWLADPGGWKSRIDYVRKHIETEYDAVKQGVRLGNIYERLLYMDSRP